MKKKSKRSFSDLNSFEKIDFLKVQIGKTNKKGLKSFNITLPDRSDVEMNELFIQLFTLTGVQTLSVNVLNNAKNVQCPPLPDGIEKLFSLKDLTFSGLGIPSIPMKTYQLANLTQLNLSKNEIEFIPEGIEYLKFLSKLCLQNNKISSLPLGLFRLTQLEILYLTRNTLTFIPEEIGKLLLLKELWVDYNQLRLIPLSILNLSNLQHLHISNNPLTVQLPDLTQLTKTRVFMDQTILTQMQWCIGVDGKVKPALHAPVRNNQFHDPRLQQQQQQQQFQLPPRQLHPYPPVTSPPYQLQPHLPSITGQGYQQSKQPLQTQLLQPQPATKQPPLLSPQLPDASSKNISNDANSSLFLQTPVTNWSPQEVHSYFLSDPVLVKFAEIVKIEDIDGSTLMTLSEDDLKILGLSMGARKKIQQLQKSPTPSSLSNQPPSQSVNTVNNLKPQLRSLSNADQDFAPSVSSLPAGWLMTVPKLTALDSIMNFVHVSCPPNRLDLQHWIEATTPEYLQQQLQIIDYYLLQSPSCPLDVDRDSLLLISSFTLESSIYKLLNAWTNRSQRTTEELKFCSPYLRNIIVALRSLPPKYHYEGFAVRVLNAAIPGLKEAYDDYKNHFAIGKEVNFHSVCSFSVDENLVTSFYQIEGCFILLSCENVKGYIIDEISIMPRLPDGKTEGEILVEGPSFFRIVGAPLKVHNTIVISIQYDEKRSNMSAYLPK